jgi:hypothetical protein
MVGFGAVGIFFFFLILFGGIGGKSAWIAPKPLVFVASNRAWSA